jgi:hypothetical protein
MPLDVSHVFSPFVLSCVIRQILEKKWEYKETVHQLFVDFKEAYESVRREVLYNFLIE